LFATVFSRSLFSEMTQISFTSGQLLDLMSLTEEKENYHFNNGNPQLAVYYMEMGLQFKKVYDKLLERPGEQRSADLTLIES